MIIIGIGTGAVVAAAVANIRATARVREGATKVHIITLVGGAAGALSAGLAAAAVCSAAKRSLLSFRGTALALQ